MSTLSDLIKKHCPDGVEYKKLKDCTTYIRGRGLSKNDKGTGTNPIILYGELYTTYDNYIYDINSFASDDAVKSSMLVNYDSIVLPISSTTKEAQIGKATVVKCSSVYLGGDAICLVPHNYINSDYLMYLLNGKAFEKSNAAFRRPPCAIFQLQG